MSPYSDLQWDYLDILDIIHNNLSKQHHNAALLWWLEVVLWEDYYIIEGKKL